MSTNRCSPKHDNASVYKARFKKKIIDSVSVEELDWSA